MDVGLNTTVLISQRDRTKATPIRELQAVAVSKTIQAFHFFETTSGGLSAQVRHLHPFLPMHPIKLAR
jgi:hypothetical protein